jgi:hypothetical protein
MRKDERWKFGEQDSFRGWTTPDSVIRIDQSRAILFRASTPTIDRYGTIIKPLGIDLRNYKKNPIFVWAHDSTGGMFEKPSMENILGTTKEMTKTKTAFDANVEFAEEEVNPKGHRALMMVKAGLINATSIRFRPTKWHEEEIQGKRITVFDKTELLDIALVPLPGNPETLALARDILGTAAGTLVDSTQCRSFAEIMGDYAPPPLEKRIEQAVLDAILEDEEDYGCGALVRRPTEEMVERLRDEERREVTAPPAEEAADSGAISGGVSDAIRNQRMRQVVRSVLKPFKR